MSICFRCTLCGEMISVRFLKPGERAQCKSCGTLNIVPTESEYSTDNDVSHSASGPRDFREQIYRTLASARLALPAPPGAPFSRALKVTVIAIAVTQVFGLILVAATGFGDSAGTDAQVALGDIGAIVLYLMVAGVVVLDMREYGLNPTQVFNLRWSAFSREPRLVIGSLAGVGLVLIGMSLSLGIEDLALANRPFVVQLLTFFVVVVVAPVCEEILFRGYLYTSMKLTMRTDRERQIVNAALFAAAHVFLPMFLLGASVPYYIFGLGFLLAYLFERTGSLAPCIALHAFNNGVVFLISRL